MVTGKNLVDICGIRLSYANIVAAELEEICPLYGINTADIFHEFIANLIVECQSFTVFEENLNYSVEGLLGKFSRKRISEFDAKRYGRIPGKQIANKQAIANCIYGGPFGVKELGNTLPSDGWDFRGSGPIQMTGRSNITLFKNFYNAKFGTRHGPELMAELLRTDLKIGIHSACWFFAIAKQLIDEAVNDEILKVCERINGGHNGLDERMLFYNKAKQVIV
jgi:putative chitinase